MAEVAARELRNHTRALLERVESGEPVTITVSGRPVAQLVPLRHEIIWMPREEFVRRFSSRLADSALAADLQEMTGGETTDDLDR